MGHIVEGIVHYLANNANHPAFETLSAGMVAKSLLFTWASYYILSIIYSLTFHPLAKYPGPKLAAVTRLWHSYQLCTGGIVSTLSKAHEKYGPVLRIAPDELLFTSSRAWDDIYGIQPGKLEMDKTTPLYKGPTAPHSIVTVDGELHRFYRRLLAKGFSDAALREQEPVIKRNIDLLIEKLHVEVAAGKTPEMTSWFNYATFDLIGELAFGETYGCLENSQYHPWVEMILEVMKLRAMTHAVGYYPWAFHILMWFVPKSLRDKFVTHRKFTDEKVQRRMDRKIDYKDLTTNLFDPKNGLERYEINGNCSTLIIAGSETTATALSATLYFLTQNTDAKRKVIDEIRSMFTSADDINSVSTNQLKYLNACINEALRIFPPGPAVFPRRVPRGGGVIDGHWIPGGTQVGIAHFCINHSKENFVDPGSYIPERWLGDGGYENDDRHAMQAFSYGPRNCIAINLARLEIRWVLARLIWEFDWELTPGSERWEEALVFNVWSTKLLNIKFVPVAR
ncbi:Cytochrome P450 [Penicillium camemberti]|uniref:Cytochrome P450 n=1 Tax=Penicillium camemberti (strain FM 013) TaxID=1429867 RepID=A0A0G4PPD1_PENC3|nr:Cytochrome P450 [Penicillium camemberti]